MGIFRVEPDSLRAVSNGLFMVALFFVGTASLPISCRSCRVEPDCFRERGDGRVEVARVEGSFASLECFACHLGLLRNRAAGTLAQYSTLPSRPPLSWDAQRAGEGVRCQAANKGQKAWREAAAPQRPTAGWHWRKELETCATGFVSAMGRLTLRLFAGRNEACDIEGDAVHFRGRFSN